jgi:tRNA pseudouridine38-40 synthase
LHFPENYWVRTNVAEVSLGRYFLTISYDGTAYAGWQSQKNAISIQEVLEKALEMVFRQTIPVLGSSRTDTGVHAWKQVAQIDFDPPESVSHCLHKLNTALPSDISVLEIRQVVPDAQCRFQATARTYRYCIQRVKSPIGRQYAHFWYGDLDLASMQACCEAVLRHSDFQAFSKVKTQVNNFVCQVEFARWRTDENGLLLFEVKANRFLRGMVRALVGTMLEVGKGKRTVADFNEILLGKNRRMAGESAPAKGLCLMEVEYPASVFLEQD